MRYLCAARICNNPFCLSDTITKHPRACEPGAVKMTLKCQVSGDSSPARERTTYSHRELCFTVMQPNTVSNTLSPFYYLFFFVCFLGNNVVKKGGEEVFQQRATERQMGEDSSECGRSEQTGG